MFLSSQDKTLGLENDGQKTALFYIQYYCELYNLYRNLWCVHWDPGMDFGDRRGFRCVLQFRSTDHFQLWTFSRT